MKDEFYDKWSSKTQYKDSDNKEFYDVIDYNKIPEELKCIAYRNTTFYVIPEAEFHIKFYNSDYYIELPEEHDFIRVYGYPENVRLHSYKEFEEFINSGKVVEGLPEGYDSNNLTPDKWLYDLGQPKEVTLRFAKEFYDKYPESLVYFG